MYTSFGTYSSWISLYWYKTSTVGRSWRRKPPTQGKPYQGSTNRLVRERFSSMDTCSQTKTDSKSWTKPKTDPNRNRLKPKLTRIKTGPKLTQTQKWPTLKTDPNSKLTETQKWLILITHFRWIIFFVWYQNINNQIIPIFPVLFIFKNI